MKFFKVILTDNYKVTGNWRDITKYQPRKYLVIDLKSETVISDFSQFKQAQILARHLNKEVK